MLEMGENQWINAIIILIFYIASFVAIIYSFRRIKQYRSTSTNSEEPEVPVIRSNRYSSIDTFRGQVIFNLNIF